MIRADSCGKLVLCAWQSKIMTYVDKNLVPGETLLYQTRHHWVVLLVPVLIGLLVGVPGAYLLMRAFMLRSGPGVGLGSSTISPQGMAIVGAILLFCTFFLSFTGYLLPWDQLGIWAVTVGTNMAGATPFVGEQARFLLIGGYEISDNTLVRWYVLHVIGMPLITAVLMAVHFWRIRKDGGISGPL